MITKFKERLKILRLENQRTQKEMAEHLGISYRQYQNYEMGAREPRIGKLVEISVYFHVSVDYLLGLTATNLSHPAHSQGNDDSICLHERLKRLRIDQKVTQKEMAAFLGIEIRQYQHYEKGDGEPRIGNLIALCEYFHVSADYLLGLSESREREETD